MLEAADFSAGLGAVRTEKRIAAMDFGSGKPGDGFVAIKAGYG